MNLYFETKKKVELTDLYNFIKIDRKEKCDFCCDKTNNIYYCSKNNKIIFYICKNCIKKLLKDDK